MRLLVIDVADGVTDALAIIDACKPDKTIRVGGLCNGVAQVMSDVTRVAPLHGITDLIFKSHGAAGMQGLGVGTGADVPDPGAIMSILSTRYLASAANRKVVSLITPYFNPKGRVALYGCHTGDDDAGIAFVKDLATIWKVPVIASTWYNLKNSATLFGSTIEAYPDGTLKIQKWSDKARMREMLGDVGFFLAFPREAVKKVFGI